MAVLSSDMNSIEAIANGAGERTQVVVIGGGPIGVEIAVHLAKAGIDYVHVEAKQLGHTMTWWAPGTHWFSSNERISIAGLPLLTPDQSKATREQYLVYLRTVVDTFGLNLRTYEPATNIERDPAGGFIVTTSPRGGEKRIACKQIILAIGGTDYPRKLGIPGDDLPHVDGYLREPHNYFGRKLLIVGGKNSAVEAALRCHHAGANVSLSYRRDALPEKSIKYWLYPEITGLMKAGRIGEHLGTVPTKITPTHVTLQPVMQQGNGADAGFEPAGESYDVEADEVLSLIGYRQRSDLFETAGVEMNGPERRPTFDEETMQTNVPGIYVAGTAVGGTQMRFKVFLENCHVHAKRIVAHLTGEHVREEIDLPANVVAQPES